MKYIIGDIIEMPKEQFECMELVQENKWIVTGENDKVVFVQSLPIEGFGGICHTGIHKKFLGKN